MLIMKDRYIHYLCLSKNLANNYLFSIIFSRLFCQQSFWSHFSESLSSFEILSDLQDVPCQRLSFGWLHSFAQSFWYKYNNVMLFRVCLQMTSQILIAYNTSLHICYDNNKPLLVCCRLLVLVVNCNCGSKNTESGNSL